MGNLVSVSDVEIQDESGKTVCLARCTSVLISVSGDEQYFSKTEWGRFMNRPCKISELGSSKGGSRTAPTSILS